MCSQCVLSRSMFHGLMCFHRTASHLHYVVCRHVALLFDKHDAADDAVRPLAQQNAAPVQPNAVPVKETSLLVQQNALPVQQKAAPVISQAPSPVSHYFLGQGN